MVLQKLRPKSKRKSKSKSSHPKKSKPHKQHRSKQHHTMAKKHRKKSSGGGGGKDGIKGSLKGIVDKVRPYATALGLGTITVLALSKLAPNTSMQTAQIASVAVPYFGGLPIEAILGAEVLKLVAGAPSILQGLGGLGTGGGGGGQQMADRSMWL